VEETKDSSTRQTLALIAIVACAVLRFVPHPADFSAIFGALVFAGWALPRRRGLLVTLSALILSDLVLTPMVYHTRVGWGQLVVWLAFLSVACTGWLLRARLSVRRGAIACMLAPTLFWIIANFGVWIAGALYPHSWSGLMQCYAAAVPFYKHELASTILSGAILFGLESLIRINQPLRPRLMNSLAKVGLASHR
jgi:hypothetical protein